jgi:Peptide N-acetyl-beta-D-glucosaminyl asparaginase amidase A
MKRIVILVAFTAALLLGGAGAAHAVTPPAEFGADWDDPRTAAPPVDKPATRSCTVQIVDHQFVNFDNYVNTFKPPAGCAGPWTKVVLHLDGAVKGRQFDRLGWLTIGDVMVFKTSTPEPSPEGIRWSVEKDISGYAPLLRSPQTVTMFLGNVVNDTFTGVLDIQVYLTFYTADSAHPAASTATDVLPLAGQRTDGADLTGTVALPRNTERLIAEVYATGSGGGCEEFWYLTAPPASGYSCPAEGGPYREVQVLLDGRVAGIAAPFPHVYTGGWSNPFLWYVLPAPRAFDIQPITYDLSPYLGLLTDGAPHTVTVHVVGVSAGQAGWHTPINFLAWR